MQLGLIGESLGHSFSASYFSNKFQQEGLKGYSYQNIELARIEDVSQFLDFSKWQGFNVTIPYKESILNYLDEIEAEAMAIGAVNTISYRNGKWIGQNTDHLGFQKALEEKWPERSFKKALILGSGGASKAVAFALGKMMIPFEIASRKYDTNYRSYTQAQAELLLFDLVINTTPLGTFPNIQSQPDLEPKGDLRGHFFMDLIYNPTETQWLAKARQAGASTLNGYKMLVHQAEASWKIWRDRKA